MSDRAARGALAAALAAYVVAFTALAAYKLAYYWTTSYDEAIYLQALHQLARGSSYVSVSYTPFLGIHAHYVHYLFAPLALAGTTAAATGLALAQAGAVAAAAVALTRLAARRGLPREQGLAIAAAWLLNPCVQAPLLADYHPEVLGVAFAAWAIVFLEEERFRPFVACVALLCATKETCGVGAAALGAGAAWARCPRRFWATALGLGLGSFLAGHALVSASSQSGVTAASFYGHLGPTLGDALWALVRHPLRSARVLATAERLLAVLLLLGPWLFLPARAPRYLLPGLALAAVPLLTSVASLHTHRYHYYAVSLAFLACAAVDALPGGRPRLARALCLALPALALALNFAWVRDLPGQPARPLGPVLELPLWLHHRAEVERRAAFDRVVEAVPPGEGVVATIDCVAHFADREALHLTEFVLAGRLGLSTREVPFPAGAAWFVYDRPATPDGTPVLDWLARHGRWERALRCEWRGGGGVDLYRRVEAP